MATPVTDLRPVLRREINIPGFEQLPDIGNSELDGYIKDGFWEARLLGMLSTYTLTDGTEFATPTGDVIKKIADDGDLEPQYQVLVAIVAAMKMLRLKTLSLAVNLRAHAGPVEYEQQASATVLRAILESLSRRLNEIKTAYSSIIPAGALYYFDGELQRDRAILDGLADLTVL